MDGYVLATDLLPTILDRYGIAVPGERRRPGDHRDRLGAPTSPRSPTRESRLGEISSRRWEVLAVNLLIWVGAGLAAGPRGGRRLAGPLLAVLATAMAIVPAILLLAAALTPSELVERLMVGAGAPLLAAARDRRAARRGSAGAPPYGAFALAAAVSIVATAIDVVVGSPLTALSLLGPEPGPRRPLLRDRQRARGGDRRDAPARRRRGRHRGRAPADPRRTVAIAVAVATVVAVLAFAPGRFGADVGAAITFPAGAAATIVVALRLGVAARRRW